MILLSLGSLGDLIIQAALTQRLGTPDRSIAVPESLAEAARLLFPNAGEVIPLEEQLSNARHCGHTPQALDRIRGRLGELKPGVPVVSLAMTVEQIGRRSANLYEVYHALLTANPATREGVSPHHLSELRASERWTPFSHLPVWDEGRASKRVLICPVGGITIKNLSRERATVVSQEIRSQGYEPCLLLTEFDDEAPYASLGLAIEKLPRHGALARATSLLLDARAVIAVDTAWYHLAMLLGVPTIGVPGPRSPGHFMLPLAPTVPQLEARLTCVDCFSSTRCVATDQPACQAVPEAEAIGAVLEARLRRSASARVPAPGAVTALPPEVKDFRRRLHQSYVFAIEEACKDIVVPVLASPIRPMIKRTFHAIRGTKD